MQQQITQIEEALAQQRYESARRLAVAALADLPPSETAVAGRILRLHHAALRMLAEFPAARASLDAVVAQSEDDRRELLLLQAEDLHILSTETHYRDSDEARLGLTNEQYIAKYTKVADDKFREAASLAETADQHERVAAMLYRTKRAWLAAELGLPEPIGAEQAPKPGAAMAPAIGAGVVEGIVRFPDGSPAKHVGLTLGFPVGYNDANPADYNVAAHMHYDPDVRLPAIRETSTNVDGHYRFEGLPAGRFEFLAVRLDPSLFDLPTRFVAQGIEVADSGMVTLDVTINEWQSAQAAPFENPFPNSLVVDKRSYSLAHVQPMRNPFYFTFPRQAVHLTVPTELLADPRRLLVFDSEKPTESLPFQIIGDKLLIQTHLDPVSEHAIAVYQTTQLSPPFLQGGAASFRSGAGLRRAGVGFSDVMASIDTGRRGFPPMLCGLRNGRADTPARRAGCRRRRGGK